MRFPLRSLQMADLAFNLRQCGDDLVAVIFRLDKSQHIVAALLCDKELQ